MDNLACPGGQVGHKLFIKKGTTKWDSIASLKAKRL